MEAPREDGQSARTLRVVERDHSSRVFDELVRTFEPGKRYRVLDLGRSFEQNVSFFSPFSSQIHFEDFSSALVARGDTATALEELRQLAHLKRFDLILCWDILSFLPTAQLQPFFEVLAQLSHSETRLSFIHFRGTQRALQPGNFKIINSRSLRYQITVETTPSANDSSVSQRLRIIAPYFVRERCYLLRHGVEEYLLRRTSGAVGP